MTEQTNLQALRLGLLVQLEQRARQAGTEALPFVIVNETINLVPYQQAVFVQEGRIAALSGAVRPDLNGPYALWLGQALRIIAAKPDNTLSTFSAADLPPTLAEDWITWLPPFGLWMPLQGRSDTPPAGLALFRAEPWSHADAHLLFYLASAYAHALALNFAPPYRPSWFERLRRLPRTRTTLVVLALLALWLPVRESVLAEAEVIARAPSLVRAPLDGVVEHFNIQPNQAVQAGQVLLNLDPTQLESKLKVAREGRDIAQAEFQQASQQALFDYEAKAKLATLQSKLEQQAAEVDYVQSLLERSRIKSETVGVAVFDNPNDWLGKPVTQGEKILAIADPEDVELEIRLPMADLLRLEPGAETLFFPNVMPHRPVSAHLNFVGYNASPTPAEIMAYRLKATFDAGEDRPRLGFRGIAKLYGEQRPFIAWVLRKPLNILRQWLGV